ncbi:MAG: hypothetical protein FJ279_18755, partial [Planctomycetes bacterium]|nr:hypothetical protein [Planctomycetota bacterium]
MSNKFPMSNPPAADQCSRTAACLGHCGLVICWALVTGHWSFVQAATFHVAQQHPQAADSLELETGWRFSADDKEAFAVPFHRDEAWPTLEQALGRAWRLANPRVRGGFVWYRCRFTPPKSPFGDGPLVVEVGDERTLDKMFLNNQPLQPAWLSEVMPSRRSPFSAAYVVPQGLLKPQENVLALRVRDFDILEPNHVGRVTIRRAATADMLNVGLKAVARDGKDGCELAIGSTFERSLSAALAFRVEDYFGKALREKRQDVQLAPRGVERVFLPIESGADYKVVAWAEWRKERGPESWEYLDPTERFGLRDALRLKGPWEFRPVTQAEGFKLPAPGDGWKPVTLPHVLKGAENLPTHRAWYRLRVQVPEAMRGKRLCLWLPSVRYKAEVFVNGQKAASKPNWDLPDEIELAGQPGATSLELLLGVTDYIAGLAPELPEPKDGQHGVPTRGVIAAAPVLPGGYSMGFDEIPELRGYPAVRVAAVAVRTFIEGGKRLRVTTKLRNASAEPRRVAVIQAVLERGKLVKRLPEWAVEVKPQAEAEFTTEAEWHEAKLWGPESPVLYQLSTRLETDGQPLDEHHARFGFREFGVRGAQFTLNGNTFHPRGASHWYPRLQPRQAEVFTCSRMFFPAHREHWLSVFDEIGAVVTQESGFGANNADSYALEDDRLYANLLSEFRRVIVHRFNHPSIMFWNQGNELRWYESKAATQKLGDLADAMKALDPTRLVTQDRGLDLGGRLRVYNPHGLAQDVGVTPVDVRWFATRPEDIPPIVRQRRSLLLGERKPWQCAPQWDVEKPVFEGEGLYVTEGRELGGWWLGDAAYLPEPIEWRPLAIRLWADRLRGLYHEVYRQAGISGFLGHV